MSFQICTGFNTDCNNLNLNYDGTIFVFGNFSTYSGFTTNKFVKLLPNGIIDYSFNIGTGFNTRTYDSIIQPDGKVIVVGSFTSYNGNSRNGIVRLNTDGTIDNTFNIGSGFNHSLISFSVTSIQIQSDNKVIVGGSFDSYNGTTANGIVRLNTDGTIDGTFTTGTGFKLGSGAGGGVNVIKLQSDGKIIVGGSFTTFNGATKRQIARLNTDGTIDNTFTSLGGFGINGQIMNLTVLSNDKIFVCCSNYSYNCFIKLNANGTADGTFTTGTGFNGVFTYDSAVQSNGKVIVVGDFTSYNGTAKNRIVRLNTDGSVDNTFTTGVGFNPSSANGIKVRSDDSIIVVGNFTTYNTNARNFITFLNSDGTDGTTVDCSTVPVINPPPAVNLTLTQDGCVPVNNLSWNQVFLSGSTGNGYRIYRSINFSAFSLFYTGDNTLLSYIDYDVIPTLYYDYYIQSYDFGGTTNSTVKSILSGLVPPTLNAVPTLTGITLSWVSNNTCDIGYTLERRDSPSGSWSVLVGSPTLYTGLTYVDTTAAINTPYDYRITSSSTGFTSVYSNIITSTINVTTPVAPTLHTLSGLTTTTVLVSWTNNQPINVDESVKTFKVFRENLSGGGYSEVASVSSGTTSTTISETINGDFRYFVQAQSLLTSNNSNTLTLPLYPNSVVVTRSAEDELNLQLFNTSTYVTAIELFRSTNSGSTYSLYQTLSSGATTYNDTGLNEDSILYYRFRYRNGTGVTSTYSISSYGLTYLSTPILIFVTQVGLTKLKVDWIDNSGKESNYEVYRNLVGSPEGFQLLTTVGSNVTTYTDTTVTANNQYEYYVRAIKTN